MYKTIETNNIELKEIYHLMISGISPRPIAFVGSQDLDGNHNLAPFSYFNAFGSNPPIIGFSPANSGRTGEQKDTLINIKETKEFSVSIVNYDMIEQVSLSSCAYDSKIDEFIKSGLSKKESSIIKPPSVNNSPFIMECELYNILELGGKPGSGNLILGKIVCFHISLEIIDNEGKINPSKLDPISRLGYNFYSRASEGLFEIHKPHHNGIGFDQLPDIIKESSQLTGNELAKLAGVEQIPPINTDYAYLDKLEEDELVKIIRESLSNMDIKLSWQAVLNLVNR